MKEIELTQGQVAMVDDEVYEYINQWSWSARYDQDIKSFYAVGNSFENEKWKTILMHRKVLEFYGYDLTGLVTDHKNHDTLDNQLSNLKACTSRENSENRHDNTSGYPGVSWHKRSNKWQSYIIVNGVNRCLGIFATSKQAWERRERYKKLHKLY